MALLEPFNQITPPGSIINSPPTPPFSADAKSSERVTAIIRVFEGCKNGYPPSTPWTVYQLNSEEYEDLQRRLKDDVNLRGFVDDKVRYDYDPISSKLSIRMTTTLHDTFASELVTEIKKKFESLKKNSSRGAVFHRKNKIISGAIQFEEDGKKFKHVPDVRFHHVDAAWPGVVIEVSYSQKRKSLVDLAENYLLASDGGIRVMVGIDLEYKKSKEASISVWRLKMSLADDGQPEGEVIQELNNELFRDAEGNPVLSSAGLELPLNNFAVQALSNGLPDCSVSIDAETLCLLLGEAEKWNDKSIVLQGVKPVRMKRKYRQRTPDDQLTTSDEERIKEDERRIRRKTGKADKSYGEEGLSTESSSQEAI